MSGIYIHIPFCKKACHYCNFHFSTSLKLKEKVTEGILKEIELQRMYLESDKIQTIYFGGGTPSVLEYNEIESILNAIYRTHDVVGSAEVTLEANPDDLTKEKLMQLKSTGINRLSIGVQSFVEDDLVWMNRSHDVNQALTCIPQAQDIGIDNISIDLIFGCPSSHNATWRNNLEQANKLDVSHLSCYGLTVEKNTALERMIAKGKTQAPKESDYAEQFEETIVLLSNMGYDHYEISNYAKGDNNISKHNTNYWRQEKYLGLGPAAHSFNGYSRQWNISNNIKYVSSVNDGIIPFEKEELSQQDIFNEYLLTGFRTKWGCKKERLQTPDSSQQKQFEYALQAMVHEQYMEENEESYVLTTKGKLVSDSIISSLFVDDIS